MKFKPEDFASLDDSHYETEGSRAQATKDANTKLKEWLDKAPVVYGKKDSEGWCMWELPGSDDTHKAKLVMIEEIASFYTILC